MGIHTVFYPATNIQFVSTTCAIFILVFIQMNLKDCEIEKNEIETLQVCNMSNKNSRVKHNRDVGTEEIRICEFVNKII